MKNKYKSSSNYIGKWLAILSVFLIIGGVFSFGFIAWLANFIENAGKIYNPAWMIGMIPLMCIIATPVVLYINKQIRNHIDTLTKSMNEVANGNLDTYIPTANAGAFSDIYEDFNKMTAEIQSIQILKNDMIDTFSHELKTPVASINGFANLMLEKDLPKDTRDKYLGIIIKESDRLSSLTKSTLMMSKIDAQEIIVNKKPYQLGKQIQECAISLETEWASKNINLSADIESVKFVGDASLMESVWLNLISNAIKFTQTNGEINLKLYEENDKIVFAIKDSGVAMSNDTITHIFDKYYQADKTHSKNGYGLGLSIVKRIINLCNGTISVESQEGEGSLFIVKLPKKFENEI